MNTNSVSLTFHWATGEKRQAEVRANAVFIHAKLVAGGMDVQDAKRAVELLYSHGWSEGFDEGSYIEANTFQPDEFDK